MAASIAIGRSHPVQVASDALGRVVTRAYQDASGAARSTTYAYDLAGNLASVTDGTSTIAITSDRLGRPLTVTVAGDTAATTSFGYHFTTPTRTDASGAYTMTIDNAGRTTAIDDPLHTANWTFGYGANGEPTTTAWPTTTSLTTTSGYDALGRLLTRVTGTRATYTETYNRASNRLTEASTITGDPGNGTATTAYDPLDRLASYGLPSINRTLGSGFDAVPNRTTLTTDGTLVSTTFDVANRPTSGGYGYDADGRMTTRSGSAGTTLRYDSLGRLVEVRQNPGNTLVARYGYDAMDRLLTVERPGRATVRFRYAGTTTAVAQVYNETAGTVERNVTTGPEGTVLADWLGTGQRLYGTNGHHDTTFTTDGAGTVTATLRYDPWGNVLRTSGTSLPEWRFQGSWADTVTNLAWSVARWYDPIQGTFITEDTLLGNPESPASRHLYAYGQGDPVGAWDPSGRVVKNLTRYPVVLEPGSWRYDSGGTVSAAMTIGNLPGAQVPMANLTAGWSGILRWSGDACYQEPLRLRSWVRINMLASGDVSGHHYVALRFKSGRVVDYDVKWFGVASPYIYNGVSRVYYPKREWGRITDAYISVFVTFQVDGADNDAKSGASINIHYLAPNARRK